MIQSLEITEQDFYHYVSAATGPEGYGVFELVDDDIAVAKGVAVGILGSEVFRLVADADCSVHGEYYPLSEPLKRFVCLEAFLRAIPSLDLVLTPTGFGVVSNQNTAPASAERVDRLRRSVRQMRDSALDDLLDCLRGFEEWHDSPTALSYFSSLVWHGDQAKFLGFPNEGRTKLAEIRGEISAAERDLIHLVSPDFHAEMTAAIRHKVDDMPANTPLKGAIGLAQTFIYACYTYSPSAKLSARDALLRYLDSLIEYFPAYQGSSAYKANHYKPFESKKDDTCFFFA